jgi:hypothetical protein
VFGFLRNGTAGVCLLISSIGFVGAAASVALAQSVGGPSPAALAGTWHGDWTGDQFRYEAAMALNVDAAGNVGGSIRWVLRVSPKPDLAAKVGHNGVEYVRGKYYAETATLVLEGYRKDDPDNILGLDKYRLVVSPGGETMGGITENHGPWNGRIFLAR